MAKQTFGVSGDKNWRVPYRGWTLADLVISNQLRPTPLPIQDLVLFCGHKASSLRQTYVTLRSHGRLDPADQVVQDHPENKLLHGTPKWHPLPDPGIRPVTRAVASETHEAAQLALPSPEAEEQGLTRTRAADIIANWVTSGKAGKDTPRFMDAWLELVGRADVTRIDIPITDSDIHDRIFRILCACPTRTVRRAIASWEAHLAHPRQPGEASPGHQPSSPPPAQEAEV